MAIPPPITYAPGSDNPLPSSAVYDVNGIPTHVSIVNPMPVAVTNGGVASQYVVQLLYQALTSFADANGTVNALDLLQNITAYDTSGNLLLDLWVDTNQQFTLAANPNPVNITPYAPAGGLTNAQLRASPVPMSTSQLPATIGQKLGSASVSVVLAGDTILPLPTGAATSALQTAGNTSLTTIATEITSVDAKLPASLGAKTSANSLSVVMASDSPTPLPTGAATAALQTAGNATLTQITGQLPATLGPKTDANSLSVVVSNQSPGDISADALYKVLNAFTGASVDDILQAVAIYDPSTVPATAISTIWKNLTKGTTLSAAPLPTDVEPVTGGGGSTASGDVVTTTDYVAKIAAAGYAIGDMIQLVNVIDPTGPTLLSSTWNNVTQGTVLGSAPLLTNLTASSAQLPPALGPQSAANSLSVYVQNPATGSTSVVNTYIVTSRFRDNGAVWIEVNDILQQILLFNSSGALTSTIWFDVTQVYTLVDVPPANDIDLVASSSATAGNQLTQITEATTTNTNLVAISQQLPAALGQQSIAGSLSVTNANNYSTLVEQYSAVAATVYYAIGDVLTRTLVLNLNSTAPLTVVAESWFNLTQQTEFAGPVPNGDIVVDVLATADLQIAGNATLTAISGQLPATLGSKLSAASLSTVLASDATLPLPTGAATAAKQDTGNNSLSSIATQSTISANTLGTITGQLPPTLGLQAAGSSMSVVVANQTSGDVSVEFLYTVVTSWTGTSVGNTVARFDIYTPGNPPTLVSTTWINLSTGATLVSPPPNYTYVTPQSAGGGGGGGGVPAVEVFYIANTTNIGAGYNINDQIQAVSLIDSVTGATTITVWNNLSQGTTLPGAPTMSQMTPFQKQFPLTLGQKTNATSLAVALASDTTIPLPTGAATDTLQTAGNSTLTTISGKLPPALGTQTAANSLSVLIATNATNLTPALITATGSGSTAAGIVSVSFANTGAAAATIGSATLPAGGTLDFSAPSGRTMGSISYNATGTSLLIATLS